jgi:Tfp pilus assembly protein PilF
MPKNKRARVQSKPSQKAEAQSAASRQLSANWIIGLILAMTFMAFINTLDHGFAYDDTEQILKNETIRSFANLPTALTTEVWFWRQLQDKDPNKESGPTTPYYRPMFTVYLMVNWALFGTWAPGWHLINLLMHLLVVYFAFRVLQRITGDVKLSAIAAMLFAVHPLRTESVAWISGATDLFLALFLLPSFYFYMLYRDDGKKKHFIAALLLFLLASFSKEPAVALPIFIALYEVFIINRGRRLIERLKPALIFSGSFLLVSAFYFAMRYKALGFVFNDERFVRYPMNQVVLTIPIVICKYIGLLIWPFWPTSLSIFHETPMISSPLDWRFLVPLVAVFGIAAALWQLRASSVVRFAILWFVGNLLPVLNLGAFGQDFLVQERYVYIPSIGFSLLLAMGLARIPLHKWFTLGSRRTAQAALVGLIVVGLTGRTLAQNTVWKDDMTLWKHGAEVADEQPMSHFVLGHKYIELQDQENAVHELERYMEINPDNSVVISNLAAAYLLLYQRQYMANRAHADRANLDRAIALCERGLTLSLASPSLWDTYGLVYTYDTSLKNLDRAAAYFGRGLQYQSNNAMLNFHMGSTFVIQEQYDRALPYLEYSLQLTDSLPDVHKFIAVVYQKRGKVQEAIDHYEAYLKMMPSAFDATNISKEITGLRARLNNPTPQS